MRGRIIRYLVIGALAIFCTADILNAQESFFGHYFATATSDNPAHAGDTRFAQFQLNERIQPLTNSEVIKPCSVTTRN
jgi:hypothetical protein